MTGPPRRFRILSLDGGGIKGTFSASFLASLEEFSGKVVANYFDLIAGTSTGGILALGLGLGHTASELLNFYKKKGPDIFPVTGTLSAPLTLLRRIFKPRYEAAHLQDALESLFAKRKLGESRVRLLIPSFDAASGGVHVFKTAHHERLREDFRSLAVDVALATSAAPTYFAAATNSLGQRFLDGGVWANCPAVLAILEAMSVLDIPLDAIDVLSVGTTTEPFYVSSGVGSRGLASYALRIDRLFLEAQVSGTVAQAKHLVRDRFLRIDVSVSTGRFGLDNVREVHDLANLGRREARHCLEEVSQRFLYAPVEAFEPSHQL